MIAIRSKFHLDQTNGTILHGELDDYLFTFKFVLQPQRIRLIVFCAQKLNMLKKIDSFVTNKLKKAKSFSIIKKGQIYIQIWIIYSWFFIQLDMLSKRQSKKCLIDLQTLYLTNKAQQFGIIQMISHKSFQAYHYNQISKQMDDYFCYWDAKTNTDLIIIIINQTIVTTILAISLLRFPNFYRLYRHQYRININKIILIHTLIVFWGIAQSAVNYYSIAVSLSLQKQVRNEQMLKYSQTYALLSSFPGYTVQTLFITICFTFCRNLVRETDIRLFPTYSIKFVFILKIYYIIRLFVWLTAILLLLFSTDQNVYANSKIEFISLISDSAIINIFIFLSIRIFINRLNPKYFRKLKIEYIIMFCCSICRIIVDSIYVIVHPDNNHDYCVSQHYYRVTQIIGLVRYSIVYNVIGNYFIHFTPISVILKIYSFDHRKEQEEQMLIPRLQASVDSENEPDKPSNIN